MQPHQTDLNRDLPSKPLEHVLAQVEQAKQEWETTVDALPQLVCLLDSHRQVLRANRTVERWGLAQVIEVKGKNIHHHLLHPGCHKSTCYLLDWLIQAWPKIAGGQAVEIEANDPFLNRYLYMQLRPIVLTAKNDRYGSFAALIIQDISPRKQLEEALRQANEVLEQRVEERTAQLRRVALENANLYETQREQNRRLQQSQEELIRIEKMAALGRLVASIAHEINNPLQSVQGFLDLLQEEVAGGQRPEKLQHYLQIADGEIERISVIVSRMRDFYRSTSPGQSPRPETLDEFYHATHTDLQAIDLHETLESVLLLTNKKLQHHHITIQRNWAKLLPIIQANPDHLKQVFLNLTLNAIDAMTEQGGTLTISTAFNPSSLSDQPPKVIIQFEDTGHGVASQALPRLFDPLFTTKEQGSGFGLYTSREIIEAHQGQITAISLPGQGTTFTIELPLEQ